jgi:hypothetical protein
MRLFAIATVLFLVVVGAAISFVVYRQLETKTALIEAPVALAATEAGSRCGTVAFAVEPRTLGVWYFPAGEGQTISGFFAVEGDEARDVGFRVISPQNRFVADDVERSHVRAFELDAAVRGDYRFEFDNRHSMFTAKRIGLAVCLS